MISVALDIVEFCVVNERMSISVEEKGMAGHTEQERVLKWLRAVCKPVCSAEKTSDMSLKFKRYAVEGRETLNRGGGGESESINQTQCECFSCLNPEPDPGMAILLRCGRNDRLHLQHRRSPFRSTYLCMAMPF